MSNIKNFVFKYRIILGILVFLIISFGVYLYVTAETDLYANQIEVKNATVTIKDGTEDFDSNDDAGNDSSDSNLIVRNFDSVEYTIKYKLAYKDDSTLPDDERPTSPIRKVYIDVLLPDSVNADVIEEDNMKGYINKESITIDGMQYYYYIFEDYDSTLTDTNTVIINITNINMKNGDKIKPYIRVRESTDESKKKYENDSNIDDVLNVNEVTVSAIKKWNLKLYSGVVKKQTGSATLPVGIAIYLPTDEKKGIKGVQIPDSISFDVSILSSSNISQIDGMPTYSNYTSDSDYVISGLPYSYDNNNGKMGIEKKEDNLYALTFSDLTYHNSDEGNSLNIGTDDEPNNVIYISTKQLVIETKRTNYSDKSDINYTITANGDSISMLDNYEPFVGDYLSKVDFINSSNITSTSSTPVTTESGSAYYNYNEEFYIQNTISYGLNIGDDLPNGITNYLKIDNTAIKLVDVGNVSDQSIDYYISFSEKDKNREYTVEYAVGEWNSNYFKIKAGAPSYCPTNLSSLTKEELMNYYGGPCIEENNNVKWYDSIESAATKDENNRNKIIAVKLTVNSEYKAGLTTTMRFKAQVKNNTSLVGNSYQVVARGMTNWKENGKTEEFYMYESEKGEIPVNLSKQNSDLTYSKLVYDNTNYVVTKEESPKNKYGNSIIVSAVKASINEIKVYDKNDSEKDTLYSGQSDPIEIQVRPVIYKSDYDATILSATVKVKIPSSLTLSIEKGDKSPSKTVSSTDSDGNSYNTYYYEYSENDIKYEASSASGTIPVLKIHAYIAIDTLDNTPATIEAEVSGKVKPNTTASLVLNSNTPVSYRTRTKNIKLRNTTDISTLGSASNNYIEKNESFTYNMRAVNLAENNANLELIKILPYSGDSIASSYGSDFSGTIGISINGSLPTGYKAYYTKDNSKTILNNELKTSLSINWTEWKNYSTNINGVTAIKIVSTNQIKTKEYFGGKDGITITLKTNSNKELDSYYNNFYILHKNGLICTEESGSDQEECSKTEIGTVVFSSNVSSTSVYNRIIEGYVFEDGNYDGFSSNKEPKLSDITVALYKTNAEITDSKNPLSIISENDELIDETATNLKGAYKFNDLVSGNYYVKYTFDCEKYTTTEKNKQDPNVEGDTSLIDSDADMLSDGTCSAVSNIITLSNSVIKASNIDLGLRVKQDFDVKINKYITNVTVTSNRGTQSYDYDKQSKVNVSVKNLKNTSFRVSYLIEIENSRYFPGTIGNIIETIPDGMTFDSTLASNDGWYESDGNLYYQYLSKTLIMPGEKYYITITLDLVTNNGGDYINFVAAKDLQIQSITNNFLENNDEDDYTIEYDELIESEGADENE